jgi:hypothetical protein
MGNISRFVAGVAACCALFLQNPQPKKPAPPAPDPPSPAAPWRADGRSALTAGDFDRAQRLFLQSLSLEPGNPDTLRDLLQLTAQSGEANPSSAALWTCALAEGLADENGNIKQDAASRTPLRIDASIRALVAARADAARDIARAAAGLTANDSASVARWLSETGTELLRTQPALDRKYSDALASGIARTAPRELTIMNALASAAESALGTNRPDDALNLARTLHGLCVQAGQKDLMTPAPDTRALAGKAAQWMARARELLRARESALPTIEQLEALSKSERDQFTKVHSDPAHPGVVLSPNGLYRIETICGIETLISAAKQVEFHHRRIAGWTGKDPFAGRQGIVRIVPKAGDMDAEGTPYWWAGGFQSGDLTILHFEHGTGGGMGRGLTHELTHRFDGALYPGMPAWLAEGRAVWTGGAYGNDADDLFIESYASFGALSETFRKGMDKTYFQKLLTGTLDDYRQNYTAGHALWVYLWSWEPDRARFRGQIDKYLAGLRTAKDAVAHFVQTFCDGKEGRPASLDLFVKNFTEFVKGFWWETPAPFTKRYTPGVERKQSDSYLLDRPAWHTNRVVAERYFGDQLACEAGILLSNANQPGPAMAALEWGLGRDEMPASAAATLIDLYEKHHKSDAAFAVRTRLRARAARTGAPGVAAIPPPPPLQQLQPIVARLQNVLKAESAVIAQFRDSGAWEAAAALTADANRLAIAAGLPTLPPVPLPDAASRPFPKRHPLCAPPVSLTIKGGIDDRLLGFDEYRVKDLWCFSPGGDVILGRKEFTTQTGLQREAWLAQTFARCKDSLSGTYSISARVRFLTSFGSGALIVGYQRHDRQFRVDFGCGDMMYAIGKKENFEGGDTASIDFGDLRSREGDLPGTGGHGRVSVTKENPSFLLEVLVDGPCAHVMVNGKYIGTHAAATGLPIEGYVGFASGNGVIQIEKPTYQLHRWDASRPRCLCRPWPDGADLKHVCENDWDRLRGNTFRGLPVQGRCSCVLWFPNFKGINSIAPDPEVTLPVDYTIQFLKARAGASLDRIPVVVALPPTLGPDEVERIRQGIAPSQKPGDSVIVHAGHAGYERWRTDGIDPGSYLKPWLFIVDSAGIIRAVETLRSDYDLPRAVELWMRVLADDAN